MRTAIIFRKSLGSMYSNSPCVSSREPLQRALSVYYFWGELTLMKRRNAAAREQQSKDGTPLSASLQTESTKSASPVHIGIFLYHGDEMTAPSEDIALQYAKRLPYREGMPGPSYTWSAYASGAEDAVRAMERGEVAPVVTERMDEALVVLADVFGWSLADMVLVMPRKVLYTLN